MAVDGRQGSRDDLLISGRSWMGKAASRRFGSGDWLGAILLNRMERVGDSLDDYTTRTLVLHGTEDSPVPLLPVGYWAHFRP